MRLTMNKNPTSFSLHPGCVKPDAYCITCGTKIHNEKNTILIVGYQAQHTLGRRILDQGLKYEKSGRKGPAPRVKFFNKEYPLKAHVVRLGGFSAHADKKEMLHFLKNSNLKIKKIALVHGEEDQILSFAEYLKKEGFLGRSTQTRRDH